MKRSMLAVALFVGVSSFAIAEETKQPTNDGTAAMMKDSIANEPGQVKGKEAASEAASESMPMEKPTPQHEELKKLVGNWELEMKFPGPDGAEVVSKGVSKIKMMGDFWAVEDATFDMMGMAYTGHGIIGYDAVRKKHISTWSDSMSSSMMYMQGDMDKDGKTLRLESEGPSMTEPGKMTTYSFKEMWTDDNTRAMEMHTPGPDGKDMLVWTMTYRRTK